MFRSDTGVRRQAGYYTANITTTRKKKKEDFRKKKEKQTYKMEKDNFGIWLNINSIKGGLAKTTKKHKDSK